jgi:hypothetical protein
MNPPLGPFAFHKHRGAGTGKSQLTIAVVAPLTTAGDPLAASADRSRVHVVSAVRNADGSRCALNLQRDFDLLEKNIAERRGQVSGMPAHRR